MMVVIAATCMVALLLCLALEKHGTRSAYRDPETTLVETSPTWQAPPAIDPDTFIPISDGRWVLDIGDTESNGKYLRPGEGHYPAAATDGTDLDWLALTVNPATGLPMCGAIDVGGHLFGCAGTAMDIGEPGQFDLDIGTGGWDVPGPSSFFG